MGPDGILPLINSLQFSEKIPPSFDGYGDYQQYRENVILWDAMTSVSAERRAPTIIGQLTGQAQVTAKTLPLSELTSESGVSSLLREMDKKFGLDTVTLLHNNISDFFDYNWDKSMSVEEFIVGFHSRLDKISKLDMNDELKGHLLLKQANLDNHDRNLVVGAAGGDYSLQALATSLRNAFRAEGFPAASMNTNRPRPRSSFGSALNQNHSRSQSNYPKMSAPESSSPDGGPTFYTFMSSDEVIDMPSAIVDSGSCCSVVGKETLDEAMQKLQISELKDEPIRQREHLFGPSTTPMKSICAVRVPFICKVPGGDQLATFNIRFDVIDGRLPFLIGLPSLLAMKGTLNFQYSNLSINISGVIYRLRLLKRSSHLELPLVCTITHQRALRENNELNKLDHRIGGAQKRDLRNSYYTPTTKMNLQSCHSNKQLSLADLNKMHKQLGHASATKMKTFIREAHMWDPSYNDTIDKIVQECTCALAQPPLPRPVCTTSMTPDSNQSHLSIDVVYFEQKPFLHIIDDRTKWSETGLLRTRRLKDQIEVLERIQLHRHGLPEVIRGDQEFNKAPFIQFCSSKDIRFVSVAANHHEGNAIVERANRSIREHLRKLALAEPRTSLVDLVSAATFHKNTTRGHNRASSFELLYNRVPRLSTICNPTQHGSAEGNIAEARRRQVQAGLHANIRTSPSVSVGEEVFFWRDNQGWIGPGSVRSKNGNLLEIMHNGIVKTADIHRVRTAPTTRCIPTAESCEEDEETIVENARDENQSHGTGRDPEPQARNQRQRRTQAEILAEENRELMEALPVKRVTGHRDAHMITNLESEEKPTSEKLSPEERQISYEREKESWTSNKAFTRVSQDEVPPGSNIVGSHVVYRRKLDGTPKARIVPWGHRDAEKNDVRGDAPSLNLDSMRLLLSLAAENRWRVRKMDVKSAYLQAKGFKRDIFVRPPREENDSAGLWKLLVPAYGLTDSGRLWYLTSYEALTTHYGFEQSKLDPSLYLRTSGSSTLILVVQVDDYLYAGSPELASNFEEFLHQQFQIGSMEGNSFTIMGARLEQTQTGRITIDASEKLDQIKPLSTRSSSKEKDRPATNNEVTEYRSLVGKLLYIGRLASPTIAFHASHAATKCCDLRLHHLRAMNATLRIVKACSCTLTYLSSDGHPFKLEAMSDASMQAHNDKTNVREGIIIFRRSHSIVHAVGWMSRLARRVARSTSTAELLAAADAVDRLTYFKHLLGSIAGTQTTELVLDSRSTFHLCSTMKEPEEIKNKLLLASIREEFNTGSMNTIRWTPGSTHLADALTKDNQEVARKLNEVLTSGKHSHPETSYVATSDITVPSTLYTTAIELPVEYLKGDGDESHNRPGDSVDAQPLN